MADVGGIAGQIARIREKVNALVEKELRNRGMKGIVPAHGPVLFCLFQKDRPVPIKAVVENARRAKSTVTVMINTLEKHGYIRKLPCDTDSRITYVELTSKGRRLQKDFEEISQVLLNKLYGDMGKSDRDHLARQLDVVESNLDG